MLSLKPYHRSSSAEDISSAHMIGHGGQVKQCVLLFSCRGVGRSPSFRLGVRPTIQYPPRISRNVVPMKDRGEASNMIVTS